jgi:DNA-binding response OmpR family regulator
VQAPARANNQIPIIMLTAKGDELSRIKGLNWAPTTTWPSPSTRTN